jgi:hypothetical protein
MRSYSKLLASFSEYKTSAWTLVAANVLPLFGVLLLGWDAFAIVALYWLENVMIGMINVLKMITCNPDPAEIEKALANGGAAIDAERMRKQRNELNAQGAAAELAHRGARQFLVPFFCVHYGIFCLVHGVFIAAFFAGDAFGAASTGGVRDLVGLAGDRYLVLAAAALAGSHLYSFFRNYLGRGEYRRTIVIWQMFQPYARVVVLHVAILFGAFVVVALGSNVGVLVVLIIGKTLLDVALHLREHRRAANSQKLIMPENILGEDPRT